MRTKVEQGAGVGAEGTAEVAVATRNPAEKLRVVLRRAKHLQVSQKTKQQAAGAAGVVLEGQKRVEAVVG